MLWLSYAITGAFLGSLSTITEKSVLPRVHASDFALVFSVTAAFLTAPILFIVPLTGFTPTVLAVLFVADAGAACAFLLVTKAMRHLEISLVSPVLLLSPFITTVLAYFVLGESISSLQLGGLVAIIVGLYVLETEHARDWMSFFRMFARERHARYLLYAACIYGSLAVVDRAFLFTARLSPLAYIAIAQVLLAIVFAGWYFISRGSSRRITSVSPRDWLLLVIVAALASGYRLFDAHAIALAPSIGVVAAIKRSSILFTTLIGGEIFHDHGLARRVIAAAIMIIGVYLVTIG